MRLQASFGRRYSTGCGVDIPAFVARQHTTRNNNFVTNKLAPGQTRCNVCGVMKTTTQRVLTRSVRSVTVNTRVTKEIRDRARAAASAMGWVPADVYRAAFSWWLDCFDAAGAREPSDIERASALASIKLAHSRISDALSAPENRPKH